MTPARPVETDTETDIAVVGMACRFPGACDLAEYWRLIASGREAVSRLGPQELRRAGAGEERIADPRLVGAGGIIEDGEDFDAPFFGYSAREAALMDPQQRMFLQIAWHALEDAGHAPARFPGRIGVYGGQTVSTHRPVGLDDFLGDVGASLLSANDKDFLTTRVSYKLGLTGPSVNVQATCATSLVAVHLACQSLLTFECDMALAGGVSWSRSRRLGYLHQPGSTLSADGRVRPFDRDASGFVPADGAGIVVLRRLSDALADGDRVYAVVKGGALNNDGADRASYAAPGVAGQSRVIGEALAVAGVEPGTIGYVEAHGTATAIGDVVEFTALAQAYRDAPAGRCGLGSVKANIGHADAAAGVAGFIKAALMLHHGFLPPCPNFRAPNPEIDFTGGPFRPPQSEGVPWPRRQQPRRAAVSAFGIGGTNAHVILQEPPPVAPSDPARPWQLLALSARDVRALRSVAASCAAFLEGDREVDLADVAWTLADGHRFDRRFAGVYRDVPDAVRALRAFAHDEGPGPDRVEPPDETVFMFPGADSRCPGMGRGLYEWSAVFRDSADECLRLIRDPETARHVRDAMLLSGAADLRYGLPALFVTEIALGRMLVSLGIRPSTVMGQGLGGYAAAYFAGVFSLRDAVAAVSGYARALCEGSGGAAEFRRLLAGMSLGIPTMPLVADGERAGREAADPEYWVRRLHAAASFARGLDGVLADNRPALVEVGPGTALTAAAKGHRLAHRSVAVVGAAARPASGRDARAALLEAVGRLWAAGVDVDLPALHGGERRVRVPFTRYPFAQVPCRPPEPADTGVRASARHGGRRPADWLYGVGWRRSMDVAVPRLGTVVAGHRWIVLSDGSELARRIVATLHDHGADPVVVTAGGRFHRLSPSCCTLDPGCPEHYSRLLEDSGRGPQGVRIVDLWPALGSGEDGSVLASMTGLAHAADQGPGGFEVCTVTRGAYRITGRERLTPESACAHAAGLTLGLEAAGVSVRCVDLAPEPDGGSCPVADLLAEFARPGEENPVGYRAGHRWVRDFRPPAADRLPAPPLRTGGTYVITGGFGGIGLTVARQLAGTHRARVVLLGRGTGRPGATADRAGTRTALDELARIDGQVLVRQADVADPAAVGDVLRETRQRFGAVHGVVHAAGLAGAGTLRRLCPGDVAAAFRAKVTGTRVLADALSAAGETPDFLVLFSSLAALTGAPGQGCYAAANAYLDAFAAQAAGRGFPVLSVNWDRWRGLGMAAASSDRPSVTPGMSPGDALAAFDLALAALPLGHVAVATVPPDDLFRAMAGLRRFPVGTAPAADGGRVAMARPELPTPYLAPRTELEKRISAVWEEALGVEGIGVHDDFFDLGGHSVIALDVVQRCGELLGAEVPVQTLFTDPTVAEFTLALADAPDVYQATGRD